MRKLLGASFLVLLSVVGVAQEKTVPAPPNSKIEGVPAVPQDVMDAVVPYGRYRAAYFLGWHPSKRQILINTTFSMSPPAPEIHLVDGPGRDRRQLTWFPAPGLPFSTPASFDPADGNTFVFLYDPGGTELKSIYRYDVATGHSSRVVESKTSYTPTWANHGKWLAYDSSERNGKDSDLYVVEPSDPSTKRRVAELSGSWSVQQWSPDDTHILLNELVSNDETYLWLIDVKTGEKKAITPRDGEKSGRFNNRLSPDGKTLYSISDRGNGEPRLWRCAVANCAWTAVTPDGQAVQTAYGGGFEISPDGALLAVTIEKGSYTDLEAFDLATLKPRKLPEIPKATYIYNLSWRPGARELGFSLGSQPPLKADVYSIDTSLGTLARWTNSESTFNADVLPAPEIVQWKSFDGLTISGILYKPASRFTGPRPVLVYLHGGPDQHESARYLGRTNYLLNELGVALIYPNVRGSSGFGAAFKAADDGKLRGNVVKDVGALLDWIPSRADLDKNKVALLGVSSGGWLALEAAAEYNDRIRGVIEAAGITNFATFLEETEERRRDNRRHEYGDERDPDMRAFFDSLSPVRRAADLKKPVLIFQPGKDARVPVSQAQELLAAVRANHNQHVWYVELDDANHDTLGILAPDYQMAVEGMFLQKFVLTDIPTSASGR